MRASFDMEPKTYLQVIYCGYTLNSELPSNNKPGKIKQRCVVSRSLSVLKRVSGAGALSQRPQRIIVLKVTSSGPLALRLFNDPPGRHAIMLKKTKRIKPADEAKSYILSSCDKPGFVERFINKNKGRGVIATQPVESGDFVLVYRGELLVAEECWARHYTELQTTFLFEFDWQGSSWCIDASKEDGTLGRLCNDNHKSPNCTMKKIVVNNRPHLCLFAVKKIEIGNEIEYNYGDAQWPWRKKGPEKNASVSQSIVSSHVMESFQDGPITQGPENNASVSQSIVSSHVMESFQDGPITQKWSVCLSVIV
ncbi:putative N-lysine methyltransferase SETD8-A-like [Triplophysa rosa]|uniref:N-lysine methyltransferase SETD8-A-like n=1 Tax=Triplophysa rosa TaxID=992332 RepID=A0A9W7WJN7_TRIRA|nr:putative N-lysine methyltransferase SETD8-A-like [Triplophysa rosa]